MDNQVLGYLKDLRASLPSDTLIQDPSTRSNVIETLTERVIEIKDKLSKIEKLDLSEITNEEISTINSNIEDELDELENARLELVTTKSSTVLYKNEINEYSHQVNMYTKLLGKAISEEEKERLQASIEDYNELIEKNKGFIDESEKAEKKLEKRISDYEIDIEKKTKTLDEARKKEVDNISQKYEEVYAQRLGQIMQMKQKLAFINMDIVPMLDSLISDYESGKTNNDEVNYRMNILKANLSDPRVNALTEFYSRVQVGFAVDELDAIDNEISSLEEKLTNDENYKLGEIEYKKELSRLSKEATKRERLFDSTKSKFDDLLTKINNIDEDMKNVISEESKDLLVKEKDRLQNMLDKLDEKYHQSALKYGQANDELNDFVKSYGKVNEIEKAKDEKRLKDLKSQRLGVSYLSKLDYMSINKRIDTLLALTEPEKGYKNINSIEAPKMEPTTIPQPTAKPVEKEGSKPEEVINPPLLNSEDTNVIAPTKDEELVAPLLTDEDKDLPKPKKNKPTFITGIKNASDKLKAKRKEILKKAAIALTTIAVAVGAVLGAKAILNNKKDETTTPTSTPTQSEQTVDTPSKTDDTQKPETKTDETKPEDTKPDDKPDTPVKREDGKIYLDVNDFIETEDTTIDAEGNVTDRNGDHVGSVDTEQSTDGLTVIDEEDINNPKKDEKEEQKDPNEGINWDWSSILDESTKTL